MFVHKITHCQDLSKKKPSVFRCDGVRGFLGRGAALEEILPEVKHLSPFPKEKLIVLKPQRKSTPDLVIHPELGLSLDLIQKPAMHRCGQRSEPQDSEEWKEA